MPPQTPNTPSAPVTNPTPDYLGGIWMPYLIGGLLVVSNLRALSADPSTLAKIEPYLSNCTDLFGERCGSSLETIIRLLAPVALSWVLIAFGLCIAVFKRKFLGQLALVFLTVQLVLTAIPYTQVIRPEAWLVGIVTHPLTQLLVIEQVLMLIAIQYLHEPSLVTPTSKSQKKQAISLVGGMAIAGMLAILIPYGYSANEDKKLSDQIRTLSASIDASIEQAKAPLNFSHMSTANTAVHVTPMGVGYNICAKFRTDSSMGRPPKNVYTASDIAHHKKNSQCFHYELSENKSVLFDSKAPSKSSLVIEVSPQYLRYLDSGTNDANKDHAANIQRSKIMTPDGKTVSLSSIRPGSIVSLYWATPKVGTPIYAYKAVMESAAPDPRLCTLVNYRDISPFCPATYAHLLIGGLSGASNPATPFFIATSSNGDQHRIWWQAKSAPKIFSNLGQPISVDELQLGQYIDVVYSDTSVPELKEIHVK